MATATATATAVEPTTTPAATSLWPRTPSGAKLDIEVFGATGEYKSGKTLLGLSIAPGAHPEGHPFAGKPRTLLLDFEKSGGTYGGTGCHRIDVPEQMLRVKGGSYSPLDVFNWFLDLIEKKIQPGQFDVIVADPITDIESGLVEYVKKNCQQFNLTPDQVRKAGGLLWGAVKDFWKQVLLKLGTQCQCFYFTSHLRQVWQGNTPTSRREPKGKETLMELASLYLWLERKAERDGKVPAVPSAVVLKERLADTRIDPKTGLLEIIQLMPPRLPEATVAAIRNYIGNPPNYAKLKSGERVPEQEFTKEEQLHLELARAEAERDAEQARLQRTERQAELQAMAQQVTLTVGQVPQASDQTAARQAAQRAAREATAAADRDQAEQDEIDRLKAIEVQRAIDRKAAEAKLVAETPPEHRKATEAPLKGDGVASPAAGGNGVASLASTIGNGNGKATPEQIARVKSLVTELGVPREKLIAMLARAKAAKVTDLTAGYCALLIDAMEKEKAKRSGN